MSFLVSPAMGKVIAIEDNQNQIKISIFLSVWDNHVQFAPFSGEVIHQEKKEGKFHPAYLLEKSELNEMLRTTIQTEFGIIAIEQIAGLLARRIRSYVTAGEMVQQGQSIGKILLGSRVNLILPSHTKPLVKVDDKVKVKQKIAMWTNII